MKITNVSIDNWKPPGDKWWDNVKQNPRASLIDATISFKLSWDEYEELIIKSKQQNEPTP